MTYITNLINAFKGKPYVKVVTQTKIKFKEYPVYIKDPHGIIVRDLDLIKRAADSNPFKIGDSLELVAYRQGQQDLVAMIERRIVKAKQHKL